MRSRLADRLLHRPSALLGAAFATLIVATTAALLLLPTRWGIDPKAAQAAGVVLFAVGLWATGAIPEVVTAMAFFLLAMLFDVAPATVVFSGFSSTALWLVFGGLFIGAAVGRTGLGQRLAQAFLKRVGASYLAILTGVALACILLSFLMPSVMGRILLLVPVTLALADSVGFPEGSRGRAGLVMTTLLATYMPSCGILPSNIPNMVLVGAAQTTYGVSLTYGRYLLTNFPVLGLVKTVLLVLLTWILFREQPGRLSQETATPAMTAGARRLLFILLIALAFWMTDFLHHISPAWIALAASVVLLLPRVGLLPASIIHEGINFGPFFLASAVLGVGAVVGSTGLGAMLAQVLLSSMGLHPGADFANYMSLAVAWTILGVLFTVPGLPAVATPLSAEVAGAAGWPLDTVLMSQVVGYSTVLMPYQLGPLIVGIALGGVTAGDGARVMLPLAALTFLLVLPLNFLWWSWLGYFE